MGDVSVIGTGAMGSAIARAFLGAGLQTTVWNRTQSKARPLAEAGARLAASPATAADSDLNVLCVDDYAVSRSLLDDEIARSLRGRTLLQVSSGSPADAADLGRWSNDNGIDYLDAALLAYPREIGGPAIIAVSGEKPVFDRHRGAFDALGGTIHYLGAKIGGAAALESAMIAYYAWAHIGLTQAAMMCEAEDVSRTLLGDMLADSAASDAEEFRHLGRTLDSDNFDDPGASLAVYLRFVERAVEHARQSGYSEELPAFASNLLQRAADEGLAEKELVSVISLLRKRNDP